MRKPRLQDTQWLRGRACPRSRGSFVGVWPVCHTTLPALKGPLFSLMSAVTIWKFLITSEHRTPDFHLHWAPPMCVLYVAQSMGFEFRLGKESWFHPFGPAIYSLYALVPKSVELFLMHSRIAVCVKWGNTQTVFTNLLSQVMLN